MWLAPRTTFAAEPTADRSTREIFVPFSDLHVLLQKEPKRVLLGREEYNELIAKAKKTPETHAPRPAAILAARYAITTAQQRAEIEATLTLDVMDEGLQTVPLDLGGVGLRAARLDGRPASIGRGDGGALVLFVEGRGAHELTLDMVTPIATTAARQSLSFRLPRPAAAQLRLTAPGDVDVKGGAEVLSRVVDDAAKATRFELLPRAGDTTLLLTLNSHLQRQERAVVARSVFIDEVTQAYEKLHASVTLAILYRAVDAFRFAVPEGFEIIEVSSPLLARWDVQPEGDRRILNVRLREQTSETVVLHIAAVRTAGAIRPNWHAPRIEPLDVAGGASVVGLLVEDRLKAESLAADGLIPIDTSALGRALPAELLRARPGAPALTAVAAWYAPQTNFSLTASFIKPPAEMAVTTSLLLVLADKGQETLGGLALLPRVERRFSFDVSVPAEWQVAEVTADDGKPLAFERYAAGQSGEAGRIRVAVPAGMPVGEEFKARFRAVRAPTGWLDDWTSRQVAFPRFRVLDATHDEGAVAVSVLDDLSARPEKVASLTPLDAAEKPKYGLAEATTALAYRYERPDYAATIRVARTKPRMTARTFAFFRVEPDAMHCRYELIYTVEDARTRRLAFTLPKETPASVSIVGLDGVAIKESVSETVGQRRQWNVFLVEARRGRVRLAVDFQQALPSDEAKGLALPPAVAEGVAYQSGLMAVEGSAEFEVRVDTPARRVDVGELADADYRTGRRLLGAYGFAGDPPPLSIDLLRRPGHGLYPTIVERCEMDTNISPDGQSQTQARFLLRTKAVYLQVVLPAGAELWSAELDGAALKPQREGDGVLIDVPAGKTADVQVLQIVYASPIDAVGLRGAVDLSAPKLRLRVEGGKEAVEVPLAKLAWRWHVPGGYEAVAADGTVVTDDIHRPRPAAIDLGEKLYRWTGGVTGGPIFLPAVQSAREAARRSSQMSYDRRAEVDSALTDSSAAPSWPGVVSPEVVATTTPAEKRIEEVLNSPTEIEASEAPLTRVIGQLKKRHGIEIQLDKRALDDVGISGDTPVTRSLKGVSLRSALRQMLRELGLTYLIQDDAILITTPDEAETRLVTRISPVGDLLLPPGSPAGAEADFDSLIDMIKSTVKPTAWDDVGGPGSIAPFENGLSIVVSETQELHEETAALLAQMRKVMRETGAKGLPMVRHRPRSEENRRGGRMGGMGGGMGMGGFGGKLPEFSGREAKSEAMPKVASPAAPYQPAPTDKLKATSKWDFAADAENAAVPFDDSSPDTYPDAKTWQMLTKSNKERLARGLAKSLAGVRSLKISILQSPEGSESVLTFRSLGVEPRLIVTLANRTQLAVLAWGAALVVGLVGVGLTRRAARTKTAFVLLVALVATVAPLVVESVEVAVLCNVIFYAAALLVPYYMLAGALRWLWAACRRMCDRWTTKASAAASAVAVLAAFLGLSTTANAEEPKSPIGPYVIQVVEPGGPVTLPDDAVIVPYNPDSMMGVKGSDKVLVPYERYVELWNRAYPEKKIETKAAPVPYAPAGASYRATLEGDEYLLVTGRMEIDVFAEGYVEIPLGLGGGVLAQAELDGRPARLRALGVVPVPNANPAAQAPPAASSLPIEQSVVVLYLSGKGRHTLDLAVRLKLVRQGGWRRVEGVLPVAPATALDLIAPQAQTEIRLTHLPDRRDYETEKAGETIQTALVGNGTVKVEWRPKVAEGQVDQTLTAASNAVLDVQEDGLRLMWRLALEFGRSQRDRFTVALPDGYLLEKVEGANVRGWKLRKGEKGQSAEIELLETARGQQQFSLRLWRAGTVGRGDLTSFDAPVVTLGDAALHTGQLTIRRSPLLDLRTVERSGATRSDLPPEPPAGAASPGGDENPLGAKPFEAYTFAAVPFSIRFAASPTQARVAATVQTLLRIAENERSIESRIILEVQDRPIYEIQALLPEGFHVDRVVAPGAFQYAVTEREKRPLLTIYFAAGQQESVPVVLFGKLGRSGALRELPVPRIDVLSARRQQGDVAVQVDPAFDVDAVNLANCERVLMARLHGWLKPEQRRLARLGLHYERGDYAGTLRLTLRKPDAACDTITNVRVTDRTIEETILLDFTVNNAGVREVSFILPAEMAESRISTPMLRQKTIEPLGSKPGGPVRVRIALQDEAMGQLRVLVQNDRLLTPGTHDAPVPTVETGRTNRRFVTIEGAGRDAVAIDDKQRREMEPLGRQQSEWATLTNILGRDLTMAYLVAPDAARPRLPWQTETRTAVETVGARIGLVETTLVVDANGAYRAQQDLRIDNATEQYLEIRLPEGAALWTATVADEPVKPTQTPKAEDPRRVRIPIIKTATGDLNFKVVLKYGGQMSPLGTLGKVEFPLVRCENIRPELSQVRLYLPEQFRWLDFGGTMRRAESEADLQAGYVKFQNKQLGQVVGTLMQGDAWAKMRAGSTLKVQQLELSNFRSGLAPHGGSSALQSELTVNEGIVQQAVEEAAKAERAPREAQAKNNREQLNSYYEAQTRGRAKNVVNDLGDNFTAPPEAKPAGPQPARGFNATWLGSNRLDRAATEGGEKSLEDGQPAGMRATGVFSGELDVPFGGVAKGVQAQSKNPQAVQVLERNSQSGMKAAAQSQPVGALDRRNDAAVQSRYKERLAEQEEQQVRKIQSQKGQSYLPLSSEVVPRAPTAQPPSLPGMVPGKDAPSAPAELVEPVPAALDTSPAPPTQAPVAVATQPPPAAGFASLDFDLEPTGSLYCFTTPQGDAEITGRPLSNDLLRRLGEIAAAAAVAVVAWSAIRLVRRTTIARLARPGASTALICLGLLSICGGILPVVGAAAVVAGCCLKVCRRLGVAV